MALKLSALLIFVLLLGCALRTQALTQISNCLELQAMKDNLPEDYELLNDIGCSDTVNWDGGAGFEPVGTSAAPFTGTFSGNKRVISGLTINRPSSDHLGLFGYMSNTTRLEKVVLQGIDISGNIHIGGLLGYNNGGTVSDCHASGSVSGSAGLGGLVATNYGLVTASSAAVVVTGASDNVGGLVGTNWQTGILSNSYASGQVGSSARFAGGLLGYNFGTVTKCYATGAVLSANYAGGLVGYNNAGSVQNTYATGSVSSNSYVGGLIGLNDGQTYNSYSVGAVTGGSPIGGFAGQTGGIGVLSSYWDTQTSGRLTSGGGTGKTTAEMYQAATYVGWDAAIWTIDEGNDYPTFVRVEVTNPLSDKNNAIGQLFSFIVPANTMEDPGDPSLDYTAQLLGGTPLPGWLAFTTATREFLGTPASGDQDTYSIEVTATNDAGVSASDVFLLTVTNRAPVQDNALVGQVLDAGATLSYLFAANTFSDGDSDPLTYTADLNGGGGLPGWIDFTSATRAFSGVPSSGDQGILSIDVTAHDGFDGSVVATFSITVNNQSPIVQTNISTQYVTNGQPFQFVILASTFHDVDGDNLTVTAAASGGGSLPTWLTFSPETQTFSGTPTAHGSYFIALNADDGFGGQVSADFELIVINRPPRLVGEISSEETIVDAEFSFVFAEDLFSDPDNDLLQYSAMQENGDELPAWLSFDGEQREFRGTPLLDDIGSVTIVIVASDGFGGNTTASFGLTVSGDTGNSSKEGLTSGQIAAIIVSITGSVLGILYTCYKFHKKRQFYKGESTKGKSEDDAEMIAI